MRVIKSILLKMRVAGRNNITQDGTCLGRMEKGDEILSDFLGRKYLKTTLRGYF